VFGSDFPHLDHAAGIVDALFAQRAALGDDAFGKILSDSPARLMGF
jgi:hypothetical protein